MNKNEEITEYDAQQVMLITIMALTPCFMMGVYVYGLDMLDKMLGGCGLAVLLAWLVRKFANTRASEPTVEAAGKRQQENEPELLAAVITGALIVFGLPSTIPIWIVFIGIVLAMIPGRFLSDVIRDKMPDQGSRITYLLERAIVTAAAAQAMLWILFREEMNIWPLNDFVETRVSPGDVATGMTPLEILADGGDLPGLSRMFIGFISGPCGEVSVAAAVIGGGYLIWKKIISPVIPVCVLGTLFAAAYIYYVTAGAGMAAEAAHNGAAIAALGPGNAVTTAVYLAFYHVMSGGAVFGAFFLAPAICLCGTKLVPSALKSISDEAAYQNMSAGQDGADEQKKAGRINRADLLIKIVYAATVGALTMFFRIKGIFVEGLAAPVLIMCIAVYILCVFLGRRKQNKAENK